MSKSQPGTSQLPTNRPHSHTRGCVIFGGRTADNAVGLDQPPEIWSGRIPVRNASRNLSAPAQQQRRSTWPLPRPYRVVDASRTVLGAPSNERPTQPHETAGLPLEADGAVPRRAVSHRLLGERHVLGCRGPDRPARSDRARALLGRRIDDGRSSLRHGGPQQRRADAGPPATSGTR